jgi:hypothetical protein
VVFGATIYANTQPLLYKQQRNSSSKWIALEVEMRSLRESVATFRKKGGRQRLHDEHVRLTLSALLLNFAGVAMLRTSVGPVVEAAVLWCECQ